MLNDNIRDGENQGKEESTSVAVKIIAAIMTVITIFTAIYLTYQKFFQKSGKQEQKQEQKLPQQPQQEEKVSSMILNGQGTWTVFFQKHQENVSARLKIDEPQLKGNRTMEMISNSRAKLKLLENKKGSPDYKTAFDRRINSGKTSNGMLAINK